MKPSIVESEREGSLPWIQDLLLSLQTQSPETQDESTTGTEMSRLLKTDFGQKAKG